MTVSANDILILKSFLAKRANERRSRCAVCRNPDLGYDQAHRCVPGSVDLALDRLLAAAERNLEALND